MRPNVLVVMFDQVAPTALRCYGNPVTQAPTIDRLARTGVVVRLPDGRVRAYVSGSGGLRDFAPGRLDAIDTMHAMTIHKAQGSQAERVTVLLPEEGSRLLTRELFYTAVTRAQDKVRVIGTEESVRAAVARTVQRASGLARRLA